MKKTLWTLQIVLALIFLMAGVSKFLMPVDQMVQGMPPALASGTLVHFIGLCEVLGALGLVLPGLLRTQTGLTALAAGALVPIMVGAVVLTLPQGIGLAVIPAVTGMLAAFVAYGRWKLAPL